MDRVADYLARAVEAEHQASRGTGLFRTRLLGLAELWRAMARKAEVLSELERRLARGEFATPEPAPAAALRPAGRTAE